jgi:hypothetical protein
MQGERMMEHEGGRESGKEKEEKMGHTIDETSGSSGFGFSIKSYIAMMTECQPFTAYLLSFALSFPLFPVKSVKKRVAVESMDIPWFIFELGFH